MLYNWIPPVKVVTQGPRVHRVATTGIPMPAQIKGERDREGKGGLPPVPYRSRNAAWGNANKYANSDGTSKACRLECAMSHKGWV